MDYGKLAYLRLEELEGTLKKNTTARTKNTAHTIFPDFPLRAGNDFSDVRFSGSGVLTAFIKIGVDVTQVGRISILLDGQKIGSCGFTKLGLDENVSLITLRIESKGEITLCAEGGFIGYLTEFSAALMGDGAAISGGHTIFSVDSSEEILAYLSVKNGQLELVRKSISGSAEDDRIVIGYGTAADVCKRVSGGFYVAYADNSQNLWLVKVANSGGCERISIGADADSVAVFDAGSGSAVVCYTREKVVYFVTVDDGFCSVSQEMRIEAEGSADAVAFVKGAQSPTLVLTTGDKVLVRFALDERGQTQFLAATVSAKMEEI